MDSPVILWLVLITSSFLCGALCALPLKKSKFLFISALVPWILFLAFNVYFERNSPDRELMQGGWPFFQATLGTVTAFVGFLGGMLVFKLRKQRSNSSFKRDALKRAP